MKIDIKDLVIGDILKYFVVGLFALFVWFGVEGFFDLLKSSPVGAVVVSIGIGTLMLFIVRTTIYPRIQRAIDGVEPKSKARCFLSEKRKFSWKTANSIWQIYQTENKEEIFKSNYYLWQSSFLMMYSISLLFLLRFVWDTVKIDWFHSSCGCFNTMALLLATVMFFAVGFFSENEYEKRLFLNAIIKKGRNNIEFYGQDKNEQIREFDDFDAAAS